MRKAKKGYCIRLKCLIEIVHPLIYKIPGCDFLPHLHRHLGTFACRCKELIHVGSFCTYPHFVQHNAYMEHQCVERQNIQIVLYETILERYERTMLLLAIPWEFKDIVHAQNRHNINIRTHIFIGRSTFTTMICLLVLLNDQIYISMLYFKQTNKQHICV